MTHFSEALAHAQQLVDLGCQPEKAVADTQRAFELDELSADVLSSNLDLYVMAQTCS